MIDSIQEYLEKRFFFGFKISQLEEVGSVLHLYLEAISPGMCQQCKCRQTNIHDYYPREISELPILGKNVIVHLKVRRVICQHCGFKGVEFIRWLSKSKYAHTTQRKNDAVIEDCAKNTLKDVSLRHKMNAATVKDIHKEYLRTTYAGTFNLMNATKLGVDEFSIAKHHTYATVVVDLDTARVIWVGYGKTVSTLNKFFKLCGAEGCKQIQVVAMDQNASYEISVKNHCPNAVVVYDLFHMIAKFGLTVLSQIRTKLAMKYKDEGNRSMYYDIKSSRWILLGNNKNLNQSAKDKLAKVLALNRPLEIAYMLKEQIRDLYFCDTVEDASLRWNEWRDMALSSEVPEIVKFAEVQERKYKDGIINSSLYRVGTSIVEGINNKIKVIKRKAYGFRDFEYFKLLIMWNFPGKYNGV